MVDNALCDVDLHVLVLMDDGVPEPDHLVQSSGTRSCQMTGGNEKLEALAGLASWV